MWIGAGYVGGGRSIVYLGSTGLTADLLRISAWLLARVLVCAAALLVERRRAARPVTVQQQAEDELELERSRRSRRLWPEIRGPRVGPLTSRSGLRLPA